MRAKISKMDVFPAIMRAVSVADKKSVVPILSHVLLVFDKDGLTLKATDLDISIIEKVPANVETFGRVAVPASTFGEIIRKTADDAELEFSLTDSGNKLLVVAGKSKFELSTLDSHDFPEINSLSGNHTITIK